MNEYKMYRIQAVSGKKWHLKLTKINLAIHLKKLNSISYKKGSRRTKARMTKML